MRHTSSLALLGASWFLLTLIAFGVEALDNRSSGPDVRVGLITDTSEFQVPCCQAFVLRPETGKPMHLAASSSAVLRPSAGRVRLGVFRLQVAALKDELQATAMAHRLDSLGYAPTNVQFDAGTDLYRVRVGSYKERAQAERAAQQIEQVGIRNSWIAQEGGELVDPAFELVMKGKTQRISGRSLLLVPEGSGVEIGRRRYRGSVKLFITERGAINVINQLPLDDYLRGVLPREMGPDQYPEKEALKALAVAARTYTLKHLGEFAAEGYDICATPRCQVYGGATNEHPLSDLALQETAGEVLLFDGRPADAMYSASCGGHTENVETVFPNRKAPYLRGVACIEGGATTLDRAQAEGNSLVTHALRQLDSLPQQDADPSPRRRLEMALVGLAESLGLPRTEDRLASMHRREVQRFIGSIFDLVLDDRFHHSRSALLRFQEQRPAGLSEEELGLMSTFSKQERELAAAEVEGLIEQVARVTRAIESRRMRFVGADSGRLQLKGEDGELIDAERSGQVATLERSERGLLGQGLVLRPGDPIDVVLAGNRVAAVVAEPGTGRVASSGRDPNWSRFRSDAWLKRRVGERYPGFDFERLEVKKTGRSGRVAVLDLVARDGERITLEGLIIRWTLDVPETLFVMERRNGPSGQPGFFFRGRGHGHGVGLCQVGAFAMSRSGSDYREILEHYYSGVAVGRIVMR